MFFGFYFKIFLLCKDSNTLKVLLKSLLLNNSNYFTVSVAEKRNNKNFSSGYHTFKNMPVAV